MSSATTSYFRMSLRAGLERDQAGAVVTERKLPERGRVFLDDGQEMAAQLVDSFYGAFGLVHQVELARVGDDYGTGRAEVTRLSAC